MHMNEIRGLFNWRRPMVKWEKKGVKRKTLEGDSKADGAFMWCFFEDLLHLRVCICTQPSCGRYFPCVYESENEWKSGTLCIFVCHRGFCHGLSHVVFQDIYPRVAILTVLITFKLRYHGLLSASTAQATHGGLLQSQRAATSSRVAT